MRAALAAALGILFLTTTALAADERAEGRRLDWDTGEGKSYWIPALEVGGFIFSLNAINRALLGRDYDSDFHTVARNLRTVPVYDKDPFSVNQIGHPYQGSVYYGFARSAGLEYWQSLLYTLGGSFLWETYGERTPPSINDHVSTTFGGSFIGEASFRMASLLLEGGGDGAPGFWRELGAAVISPSTGFNRLVFGERFAPVFPSRDPEVFIRLQLGATVTTHVDNEGLSEHVTPDEGSVDYSIAYGLPGKPGYRYRRPFDYFYLEFTGVPNSRTVGNAVENFSVRGLLIGDRYESASDDYRGVWGLFGGYDYLSPQLFRVATANVGLGTVGQWWLSRTVALQSTAVGGLGFGAAGTVSDAAERDYHYGIIPQLVLGLRLIFGERAMLETNGRQYFVIGTGSGPGPSSSDFGAERISRGTAGLTIRLWGPHALGVQYTVSSREARVAGLPDRHQLIEAVTVSYNFLGQTRFGATEWRPAELR
jgi:uncharacterized protein DUF3943